MKFVLPNCILTGGTQKDCHLMIYQFIMVYLPQELVDFHYVLTHNNR